MEKLKEHKDYLIGLLITALIGAIASALKPNSVGLSFVVDVLLTTFIVIFLCFLIAGRILGISWIFTKNFTLARLIRISIYVCVTWTISAVIYAIQYGRL